MYSTKVHVSSDRLKPLRSGSRTFRSSVDFSVTQKDIDKARKELNETEDVRESALQEIRQKIKNDPTITYRTDDSFLLRYLRYTKFDCDQAYQSMREFYVFREKHPHLYSLSQLEKLLDMRYLSYFPYLDEEGCFYFWIDFRKWKISQWSAWDIFSLYHAMSDVLIANPNVQINGIKGLWDMRGLSFRHAAYLLNPSTMVFMLKTLQELYPYRFKKIVAVHCNNLVLTGYTTVRPFLKDKIRDRIVAIGTDMTELHKYYNPTILPKEYGGQLDDNECYITRHIMDNINYLKYDRSFGKI